MAKILVVDDATELLDIFSTLLKMKGFEVATAASKKEFENIFPVMQPDLILLDVRLNGHDGREVCREIKETNAGKHIAVILLSASPELLEDYKECGAVDVIEKPFELQTIIDTINRALN